MAKELTLDEYVDKAKKELETFRAQYRGNQVQNPEYYPEKMEEG